MPLSKEHKAQTRERIVRKASAMFRRSGLDGVSVPGLMKEAGLTHGGFYAHFDSKDALIAEAIQTALSGTARSLSEMAEGADGSIAAVVDEYVSAGHRDSAERGCAIAAIGPEAARAGPEVAAALTAGIHESAARLRNALGLSNDGVLALYAGMIGAIVLARACSSDREFSDHILEVCRTDLKKRFGADAPSH
jgi:TetR/AcrR family transcriptional repressor of nem operon